MIKQASENDIQAIEEILLDSVKWLNKSGLENGWNESNIKWKVLSKSYKIEEFYIDYVDGVPAGCMALTNVDKKYWPEIQEGKSLYLHKLAVKREFAGRGLSKELITFTKNLALEKNIKWVRLDCNFYRDKLRKLYENAGFTYVGEKENGGNSRMALYVCQL